MNRRSFITTAVSAAVAVAARQPVPERRLTATEAMMLAESNPLFNGAGVDESEWTARVQEHIDWVTSQPEFRDKMVQALIEECQPRRRFDSVHKFLLA